MYASAGILRELHESGVTCYDKQGNPIQKDIIENTKLEQWNFIEGSAFNLRLSEVKAPLLGDEEGSFIGVHKRVTPRTRIIEPSNLFFRGEEYFGWMLPPGSWNLLVSEEITNIPPFGFFPVKPRFTFASSFSSIVTTDGQPNYQGKITALIQVGPLPLRLEFSCDFCFVRFAYLTDEDSDAYQGIWGTHGCGSTTQGQEMRAK